MILRDGLHLYERIGAQYIHERGWHSKHLDEDTDTQQQDEAYHPRGTRGTNRHWDVRFHGKIITHENHSVMSSGVGAEATLFRDASRGTQFKSSCDQTRHRLPQNRCRQQSPG